MSLAAYLARRLALLVPVLLTITVLVFALLTWLPGDPATALLGPYATPERMAELTRALDLDRPAPFQYLAWLKNALAGDLGRSYSLGRDVTAVIAERLGPTVLLASAALSIGVVLGLLVGTLAAAKPRSIRDRLLTTLSLLGLSTPSFWLAMLLMWSFAVSANVFPVSGMRSAFATEATAPVLDVLSHLVLPSLTLGLVASGVVARLMRAVMLDVLAENHMRTARAKGVPENVVVFGHAVRTALPGIVPVIGLQAGFVLGGAVYVETVFEWPGLGRMLVEAIAARDALLVQGAVVVLATLYVIVNLVTDVLQRMLDPRLR